MSANTAELTLIIKAQNLADSAFNQVKIKLTEMKVTAGTVARDMATAFRGIGKRVAGQLGNLATDILSGGSLQYSLVAVGATLAGALAEGLAAHLLPEMLARLGKTALFAPLAAAMASGGVTVGVALSTAIGVGMAAAPFIILAAAVAALVYLIQNPEARQKAREVALMIIGRIGDGLRDLGVMLYTAFSKGMSQVLGVVRSFVAKIVAAIMDIPRAVGAALTSISRISLGPTLKDITGHAAGGWVGLHGPEIGLLGENGPEYITPNHKLGDMGGTPVEIPIIIDGREIARVVDSHLYYKLQRAVPTARRI